MSKKQNWDVSSVFVVPQKDGDYSYGQVVGRIPKYTSSAICAFYNIRTSLPAKTFSEDLDENRVISLLFVTRDMLDSGYWKVVRNQEPKEVGQTLLIQRATDHSGVGTKIIGSGIVRKFLNAYFGLQPWDAWHDPEYLDGLLIRPSMKPPREQLIIRDTAPRQDGGAI